MSLFFDALCNQIAYHRQAQHHKQGSPGAIYSKFLIDQAKPNLTASQGAILEQLEKELALEIPPEPIKKKGKK
jgi:hypothetical protein